MDNADHETHHLPAQTRTLTFTICTTADTPIATITSGDAHFTAAITRSIPTITVTTPHRRALIELDDVQTITDGHPHQLAITTGTNHTTIYLDGNIEAASTLTNLWDNYPHAPITTSPAVIATHTSTHQLTPADALGHTPNPEPYLEFATNQLHPADAHALNALGAGTITIRFRTRGIGQTGTIFAAATDTTPALTIAVTSTALTYTAHTPNGALTWECPGHWATGNWHELAITSAHGATSFYIDGERHQHLPGQRFFAQCKPTTAATIGQDCTGLRLYGEVAAAKIFDHPLSHGQIRKLAHAPNPPVIPVFDRGLDGAASYRIPALLALPDGTLIAGADKRVTNPNDAPNEIHYVTRTSHDQGHTWGPPNTILAYPGGGAAGASVIDSNLTWDPIRQRIHLLIAHFPATIGQFNAAPTTGFTPTGKLKLAGTDGTEYHLDTTSYQLTTASGTTTPYRVAPDGTITAAGQPVGNITDPPGSPTPLRMAPTSYLLYLYSDDLGHSFSQPVHLNAQLKEEWMTFLGAGPGTGITLTDGPHRGRIVIPYYATNSTSTHFSAGALYSDDGGTTWERGQSVSESAGTPITALDDKGQSTYEATIVPCSDGRLLILMRNQHPTGRVATAYSTDGGATWGPVDHHPQLPEIFSQPHAIAITSPGGHHTLAFANATALQPYRGAGYLRLSTDDGATWPRRIPIRAGHYVYQCLAQIGPNQVGVLWENEWQGLFFTPLPLAPNGLGTSVPAAH